VKDSDPYVLDGANVLPSRLAIFKPKAGHWQIGSPADPDVDSVDS